MKKIVTILGLIALMTHAGVAQEHCDHMAYQSDPTGFADLAVEDFQSYSLSTSTWDGTDVIAVGDINLTGTGWIDSGWCIPNMDSNYPGCGGTNLYVATPVDLFIEPQVAIDRIGFDYGTQGNVFYFDVLLSDSNTVSFVHENSDWTSATGFFGYCTGSEELSIVSIHLTGFDGGIDNVRYGTTGTVGSCSSESLEQTILDMHLHIGMEKSLLTQLRVALSSLESGDLETAQSILGAMRNHIEAQSGKKLSEEQAQILLECILSL